MEGDDKDPDKDKFTRKKEAYEKLKATMKRDETEEEGKRRIRDIVREKIDQSEMKGRALEAK